MSRGKEHDFLNATFFPYTSNTALDGILNFQYIGYNVIAISSLLLTVTMLKLASKLVILNSNIQMLKTIFEFVPSLKVNTMFLSVQYRCLL